MKIHIKLSEFSNPLTFDFRLLFTRTYRLIFFRSDTEYQDSLLKRLSQNSHASIAVQTEKHLKNHIICNNPAFYLPILKQKPAEKNKKYV